eukprot:2590502-Rhodomonas_salina.1
MTTVQHSKCTSYLLLIITITITVKNSSRASYYLLILPPRLTSSSYLLISPLHHLAQALQRCSRLSSGATLTLTLSPVRP